MYSNVICITCVPYCVAHCLLLVVTIGHYTLSLSLSVMLYIEKYKVRHTAPADQKKSSYWQVD